MLRKGKLFDKVTQLIGSRARIQTKTLILGHLKPPYSPAHKINFLNI